MMFGFSKKKTPLDLVKGTKDWIAKLAQGDKRKSCNYKANEETSKNLISMKAILYGDGVSDPSPELVAQLSHEIYNNDILPLLIGNICKLEFEAKKDVSQIFNNLLRRQIGTRFPTAEYVGARPEIFVEFFRYENQDIALHCGMILRECIRHEILAKQILDSPQFWKFFVYVELPTFDVASDAFQTFKDLLTKHKAIVSEFLTARYTDFFEKYTSLLNSSNYVTKRQSLNLLGEVLLDRTNYSTMVKCISSPDNLKLMMNLLRDMSRNIQFEAFHVFKVFVANPNKAKPILDILQKNKEKLVAYLTAFHATFLCLSFWLLNIHFLFPDDETFADEKAFLIKSIQDM
ncbi:UNVERIFIED_CONTAM: hypothetical protein HDU68_005749 [Siphonaria sp. JEL0065]|nr:hypothetical protein HDU68_005749 [Siphonaria sp. JEL0065]